MGDDVIIQTIKLINSGANERPLFQINIYNDTENRGYTIFIEPEKLNQMLVEAAKDMIT